VRKTFVTTAVAAGALLLAACTSGGGSSTASGGTSASGAPAANVAADLKTFDSPIGAIAVSGGGMTVYAFDKDTPGSSTSACTGQCASLWFPVTTTSSPPIVQGVTGMVGTLPTADGKKQITLAGHRLYTFSGDGAAGQITGQGFQNLWWVVSPDGGELKKLTGPAAASSSSSGYMGY
jgi:predicted lipoprotein with Yx(FWY)xxD motif